MDEYDSQKEFYVKPVPQNNSHRYIYVDVLYHMAWAISFWKMVGQTDLTRCPEPVWLWVNFGKYFYLINAVMHFLSLFFLTTLFFRKIKINFFMAFLFLLIATIARLSGIIFIVGISVSFLHRDRCADLEDLVTVQLIFMLAILTVLLCKALNECFNLCFRIKSKGIYRALGSTESQFMGFLEIMLPIYRLHYAETKTQEIEYLTL